MEREGGGEGETRREGGEKRREQDGEERRMWNKMTTYSFHVCLFILFNFFEKFL